MSRSPWAKIANATITFNRPTRLVEDPETGNELPGKSEEYTTRAYFKKTAVATDKSIGVPIGSYPISGYTVGILPDWCKDSHQVALPCSIDHLGSGLLTFQGRVHVVKDKVEKAGRGSQVQGYFVLQGSN